ncbi:bifunctional chorismate mutase/prephenate dehydrogenase [Gemmatimonas aurantiaca]|uniref:bifunctional chorismate mutase/prephenate dehydrogenase n=1 Tax=Gemmatimonas aurantiaca TaxID=173480 RepID=UPI00301C9B08
MRAMIDALDRDLLQIMARRKALVAEVAAWKRQHGMRIRDLPREQQVLRDRQEHAEELGLPVGEVESIFRLLLRASRDQQAALRAEVPIDQTPRTVAIIGGHGKIGRLVGRLFADLGHRLLIVDTDTALRGAEAARVADVTVVSVPIERTEQVIRELGPHVRADALLMDVTSIKEAPMRAMLESTTASVVGTHPMFGPSVHTLQGQRLVLCRGRGDVWADWVARTFAARGLVVTETTAEQHDRAMSVVQVLTHFQTQVLGLTLARMGVPLSETLPFTSPAYLLELYVAARHFAQDPALYGSIEMRNPRTGEVTAAFGAAVDELAGVIADGDQAAFTRLFEDVRGFFGDFTAEALEQSSFLIDRIVERQ